MSILNDQIFFSYKELVDTYLRNDFRMTEEKRLVLNCMEVQIRKIGSNIWRASIVTNKYKTDT
jgi:hypothetical protein